MNYISDILLIDDQIEEAYDIQKNLLKLGFNPVISKPQEITESFSMLPSVIFCDINLFGTIDDINFKSIKGILKKIYKKNTPYFFIIWTTHSSKISELEDYLHSDQEIVQPLEILSMNKNDIDSLETELNTLINRFHNDYPDFIIFSIFRDIIFKSSNDVIDFLNDLYSTKDGKFRNLLLSIAEQNYGIQNLCNNENYALATPISYFIKNNIDKNIHNDSLHSELLSLFKNIKAIPKKEIDQKIKSKINTIMHINGNVCKNIIIPGDFFKTTIKTVKELVKDNKLRKEELLLDIIKDLKNKNAVTIGLIEISADCDFANCNTMNIGKFVLAYLCPYDIVKKGTLKQCYQVFDIEYKNKSFVMIVDARFIISVNNKKILTQQKLFNIREGLFKKIRNEIYMHNSRLGTISF